MLLGATLRTRALSFFPASDDHKKTCDRMLLDKLWVQQRITRRSQRQMMITYDRIILDELWVQQ